MFRTHISYGRYALTCLLVISLIWPTLALPIGAEPAPENLAQTDAVDKAMTWLLSQQQSNGSFDDSVGTTVDAILAGAAAGYDISAWRVDPGAPSALDFVASQVPTYTVSAGATGKLLAGVVAAGQQPVSFGGHDLIARALAWDAAHNGQFASDAIGQAWAVLGLLAARAPLPDGALAHLLGMQEADGGWGFPGWGSDLDTTALTMQTLIAAGVAPTATAILSGTQYIQNAQVDSGGFSGWGATVSESSTAWAIQALIAAGLNPQADAWRKAGRSPLDDLLSLQLANGGFKGWTGEADVMTTAQVVPALLGKVFPLRGTAPALADALSYLRAQQQADGGFGNYSAHALLALSAIGEDARLWRGSAGISLLKSLEARKTPFADAGAVGRLVTGLAMARENPYLFGGKNLLASLWRYYNPATGSFDVYSNIWNQSLALWALAACAEPPPALAVTWLREQRNADGGWGWATGISSDSNSTALAIQALVACGVDTADPVIVDALAFLKGLQTADGGFPWDRQASAQGDADSTALALQGILAAGGDPYRSWEWARTMTHTDSVTMTVRKPVDHLLTLQTPEGGFEWLPGTGSNVLATMDVLPALKGATYPTVSPSIVAARRALEWIIAQQQADGSFGASAGVTLDVLLAAAALGRDASEWRASPAGASPWEYLGSQIQSYPDSAGKAGKLLACVVAAGKDPLSFYGSNLVTTVRAFDAQGNGQFAVDPINQAWAMLGLRAARKSLPDGAAVHLLTMQLGDGGWGSPEWGSDPDSTALAIQALIAAGESISSAAILSGTHYLKTTQVNSGGFTGWGATVNESTTAWVLQALAAAEQSPFATDWLMDGRSALDDLLSLQLESGAFKGWTGEADIMTTAQVISGLLLEPLPFVPAPMLSLPLIFGRSAAQ